MRFAERWKPFGSTVLKPFWQIIPRADHSKGERLAHLTLQVVLCEQNTEFAPLFCALYMVFHLRSFSMCTPFIATEVLNISFHQIQSILIRQLMLPNFVKQCTGS
jgi:hypothetical protein